MKFGTKLLAAMVLFFSIPSWAVVVDGKDWLQPSAVVNNSWNDFDAQCPAPERLCVDGDISGIAGYTWANRAEVGELFNSYPDNNVDCAGGGGYQQLDSTWAPAIITDFGYTFQNPGNIQLIALTSDAPGTDAWINDRPQGITDTANCGGAYGPDYASVDVGFWLYRSAPSQVPTLSSYGLILTILGLVIVATRRLSRRKVREG